MNKYELYYQVAQSHLSEQDGRDKQLEFKASATIGFSATLLGLAALTLGKTDGLAQVGAVAKPWVSLPPPETSTFPTLLQYPLLAGPIEGVIHFKGCARSIPVVCRGRWRWVAQVPPVQKLGPSSLPTPEPRPGRLPAP